MYSAHYSNLSSPISKHMGTLTSVAVMLIVRVTQLKLGGFMKLLIKKFKARRTQGSYLCTSF